MKATELVQKLKDILEAKTNDQVLKAVEDLLLQVKSKSGMPFGVLLMVDPNRQGQYWPVTFGEQGIALQDATILQGVCQSFAIAQLGPMIDGLKEKEIEARVRAELGEGKPPEKLAVRPAKKPAE
jgi:hypothetical protein